MKPTEFIHEGANDALIAALNKKHPGPCPHERVERMNANQVHCKDCGKMITTKPHAPITSPLGEGPDQRVKIISGPSMYIGKTGVIGQISQQHAKMYPGKVLVNLDHGGGSTLLPKEALNPIQVTEDASGGASCAGAIAAGPAGNLFSSTVKRKKKKSAVGEGIDLVKEMWGASDHAPDQMSKREEAKYLSRMKAGQKARNAKRKADTQTANRADRSSTPQSK